MATTQTLTLDQFLLARIAEDESGSGPAGTCRDLAEALRNQGMSLAADWLMVQRARLLAECEAKRRLVELHRPDELAEGHCRTCWDDSSAYCPTLRLVALPYVDHEQFQEEWRA